MYKLSPPNVTSSDSYNASVATIRSTTDRSSYEAAVNTVKDRCDTFDAIALSQQFDKARGIDFEIPEFTTPNMMADLYDKQFARGHATQAIRDSIRNAAPNSLCPYCGEGIVAELDHYLPKSAFAGTTVHPSNLVPSCRDCNYVKKAYVPSEQTSAILHPYYDDVLDTRWLKASLTVSEQGSPVIYFFVSLEQDNTQLQNRLKAHIQIFDLQRRFSLKAAQLLNNFQTMLASEYGQSMSLADAKQYLKRQSIVYQGGGRINSWEASAYEAMLVNDWYLTDYLNLV